MGPSLLRRKSNYIFAHDGAMVLTEVPEMLGVQHIRFDTGVLADLDAVLAVLFNLIIATIKSSPTCIFIPHAP